MRNDMEGITAMGGYPSEGSGKQRMRWTPELRDCFEEAVNRLGGPDRATPKGILKAMSVPGVTIAHVKSYLQKYRMSKFVPESTAEGRLDSRKSSEVFPNFSATSRVQLTEALQLHREGNLMLDNPQEVWKPLKMKLELQGRYLDKIVECGEYGTNSMPQQLLPPRKISPLGVSIRCEPNTGNIHARQTIQIQQREDYYSNEASGGFQIPKRLRIAKDAC